MHSEPTSTPRPAAGQRILLAIATLVAATALSACGGGGGGSGINAPIAPTGNSSSTAPPSGVVVTPNDPATAGPSADAVTPPGTTPDNKPPARRPETVRCAP
ncbi:hypothetical protein AB4Z46_33470 [Variovorax sp. M-6]|uniref:hypothetical protein n=1 Tax=Variovorax sp. M-6 TaxID=3233041 RepID=UPI003F9E6B3C